MKFKILFIVFFSFVSIHCFAQKDAASINYLLGKTEQSKDTNFILVETKYAIREGMYLRKEVYAAFIKMYEGAEKEGIKLTMLSATRSFYEQKTIWENKWTGKRSVKGKNLSETISDPVERAKMILNFSAMPGTSRHHWGTDVDLISLEDEYFQTEKGKQEYEWLKTNAIKFGFCQPYSIKNQERPTGYEEEKWHWSYLPLAKKFTNEYSKNISYSDITGFLGAETAKELNIIEKYVLGISSGCKEY